MAQDLRDKLQSSLGAAITLERELGGGGMSRVFVADDNSLGRKIVVKILPSDTAAGVSVERFKREIQVVARLQHPHIVPVLSAGEIKSPTGTDDVALPFYTMPFVKGESLRSRLARGGELSVNEAVHLLRDVAAALAYAHGEGVVHRDIKPDNVIVSGGVAVVTDFGVAKAVDIAASSGDRPQTGITSLGVALGTPAYMAPEQASADPKIDHRADIYAFGVLAYELLAGSSPFAGRPPSQILAAQVTERPEPIQKRRPNVPPPLAALVMKCLEKQAGDRPQSADEILTALDAIATTPSGGMAPTSERLAAVARSPRSRLVVAGVAVLVLAAIAAAMWNRSDTTRLAIGNTTPIATTPALEGEPAISPDGRLVAYTAATPDGNRIFVRQIDGGRSTMLTGGMSGVHLWPRWSPDGSRISFVSANAIYVVPALTGGTPRRLIEQATTHAWSKDGTTLVFESAGGIFVQPVAGGERRRIVQGDLLHSPALSPDGKLVAYVHGRRPVFTNLSANRVWVVPASGGTPVAVSDSIHVNVSPAWMPDGRSLVYVSSAGGTRDVYSQRLKSSGEPDGPASRVTTSLASFTMTLSGDGTRLAYDAVRNQSNIAMVPIGAGPARISDATPITNENQTIESMSLSPDGKWLAFDSNRGGNFDIYKVPVDGSSEPVQVTTHPANDFAPTWSPDGREITFHTPRNGTRDIYTVSAEGGAETQVTSGPREDYSPSWGKDGRIAFHDQARLGGAVRVAARDASGKWSDHAISGARTTAFGPKWSPDGRWIAQSTSQGLGLSSPDGATWRMVATTEQLRAVPRSLGWSADGSTIFVSVGLGGRSANVDPVRGAIPVRLAIIAVPVNDGTPRIVLAEEPNARFGRWEFATDGKRLFFTRAAWESDVWVMDLTRR